MNVIGAVVAGIIGTASMIVFMLVIPAVVGMPTSDIAGYMGLVCTANPKSARLIGAALLSSVGVILAIICALLWNAGIGSATWLWGLILGGVFGIGSILFWFILMKIHPRPSEVEIGPVTVIGPLLWIAHLIFGLVTALIYGMF